MASLAVDFLAGFEWIYVRGWLRDGLLAAITIGQKLTELLILFLRCLISFVKFIV